MQEGPDPARLQRLDEKIAAAKRATDPRPRVEDHYSAASQGWRMVIELVAGLALGFGIGYGLDTLFGTMPISICRASRFSRSTSQPSAKTESYFEIMLNGA